MLLIDQLDFTNPDHVTILCKDNRQPIIHISDGNSSVRLTYQLQQEDNQVTYEGPYFCKPPHPPVQPDSDSTISSNVPGRLFRGM